MDETISLLPFIKHEGDGLRFDIPVLDGGRMALQGYSYPFQVVEKDNHFSIIVKSGIKVKGAEQFKSLFMLVQRDDYPISSDGLTSFTNTGMDRIWHDTIQFYSTDKNCFIVPGQVSGEKSAAAFSSLFYCKKQETFFHPPCPECGDQLDLCRDDDLLISHSLFPYSTSLKRYLFCPRCHGAKTNFEFYQFSRTSDDLVFTKDRFDLIKDFTKLRSIDKGGFPCPDCPAHAECYITGEKAASRISFFSFYPFYMLFFDAEPIKAIDFLPLLSGAPFEKNKSVQVVGCLPGLEENSAFPDKPRFFFEGEDRFFLEVLFLKLSFFEAFSRSLYDRVKNNAFPLINLSAQSIWVRPRSTGNNLPFFWSFKVSMIDLIVNSPRHYIPSVLSKNTSLQFIAALFFEVFLANRNQGPERVYEAVGALLENGLNDSAISDYTLLIKTSPAMAMENIFWNKDERSIPGTWQPFWLKTLRMGLGLFESGNEKKLADELNQLIRKTGVLKQDIKLQLFSTQAAFESTDLKPASPMIPADTQSLSSSEKLRVLNILKGLKAKWAVPDEAAGNKVIPDLDDDVLETIVLSSHPVEPDRADEPDGAAEENSEFDDFDEKTMILEGPGSEPDVSENGGFDDMEETVILTPEKSSQPDSDFFSEEDDLDKTVIINPEK